VPDLVISPPVGANGLGLARLKLAARGRLEVRGRVGVERGVRVRVARGARVVLEDGCRLGEGCRIEANGGIVRVGPGAVLGARSVVVSEEGIDIGAGCVVGDWAMIADAEPTYDDPERPTRLQPLRSARVRVGDGARIGAHAVVQATIADGDVVAPYETRAPVSAS
jgi:acetyltransferase-like isoleucine patch superfamily enzyme